MEEQDFRDKGAVFTKVVKAGKRTYFFDVKSTRGGDHYLTVTESKKRFTEDGKFTFDKHKLFVYREDFDKFMDALQESMGFIAQQPAPANSYERNGNSVETGDVNGNRFNDVSFEDLGQ
jgi:hypothetical protein